MSSCKALFEHSLVVYFSIYSWTALDTTEQLDLILRGFSHRSDSIKPKPNSSTLPKKPDPLHFDDGRLEALGNQASLGGFPAHGRRVGVNGL